MPRTNPRARIALATTALALALAGAGCFNDAFRGHDFHDGVGTDRFELVVEPGRTQVDGTHFLVDRATGDLWRLDVSDGTAGTWVRLADGPADAAPLRVEIDVEPKPQDEG
jgi:hypothetical protein